MIRKAVLSLIILLGFAAVAQEFPRAEVAGMYSYSRFAPAAKYANGLNMNGGGGSLTINFNDALGIKAELDGFVQSKATFTIPAGAAFAPAGGKVTASGNLFTYLFGPQVKFRAEKLHPYVHALFGGAHSSLWGNFSKACTGVCTAVTGAPSANAFAMALGGGVDIPVSELISIRVGQLDYLLTRFSNPVATNNQNNFRYSAGVVFSFGNTSQ